MCTTSHFSKSSFCFLSFDKTKKSISIQYPDSYNNDSLSNDHNSSIIQSNDHDSSSHSILSGHLLTDNGLHFHNRSGLISDIDREKMCNAYW